MRMSEADHQVACANPKRLDEIKWVYAGNGNPAPSLLDSTVRVTIRQSDSEAIASEAATASLNRIDATATAGLEQPTGPEDRGMVEKVLIKQPNQSRRAERISPIRHRFVTVFTGKIA